MDFQEKMAELNQMQHRDILDSMREFHVFAKRLTDAFTNRCEQAEAAGLAPGTVTAGDMAYEFGFILRDHCGPIMSLHQRSILTQKFKQNCDQTIEEN